MEQLIGIILHWIGGFSSASFYVPYSKVKKWSWITYWITLGFVAWIIMPTVGGLLTTPDLFCILGKGSDTSMVWTYVFGILWGFGGLMAGLALRYLGLSLGQSITLGVSAIVGTVIPAIIDHKIISLVTTPSGLVISLGLLMSVLGIIFTGYAGILKDRLLTDDQKKGSVREFSLGKGLAFAILGGIMSACMAFAFLAGKPIADTAVSYGTAKVFMNMPLLVLALGGGFTTNFIYAIIIAKKNRSLGDYIIRPKKRLLRNYFLSICSGLMWYGQFFFYGMGTTEMGRYDFASWSIHMSSIIIFSNLWGVRLKEWKEVNHKTLMYLWVGIGVLVISVIMIGVGNYMVGLS